MDGTWSALRARPKLCWSIAIILVIVLSKQAFSQNLKLAEVQSDAQARCVQKLGTGAVAEKELDFGEVTYVCNCAKPFEWNEDNTKCVGASGDASAETLQRGKSESSVTPATQALSAEELNKRGYEASEKKNYQEAMTWFRRAAEKGLAKSMFNIALQYYRGQGVAQDRAEAFRWFKRSAEAGDTIAKTTVGWRYFWGDGVKRDYSQALIWTKRAAAEGDASAMANLGVLYNEGKGVRRDYGEAMFWYRRAADKNNGSAMANIGDLYFAGLGVRKNRKAAASWYEKAVSAGNKRAMVILGQMLVNSWGVRRDYHRAVELFETAGSKEHLEAWNSLAAMYAFGLGVSKDPARAASLAAKALRAGYEFTLKQMTNNHRTWGKPFRRELQKIMRDEGVYEGAIDGSFGPATKRAIRKLAGK